MPSEIDVDKAKAEGKVQLYTSLDTKIVDAITGPFKEKYGISVEYFRGGSADVTSKVLAEADAGGIQADMVDASDLAALLLMKERGLLLEKKSDADAAVSADLRDPDGTWMADRLTQAVIQFNTAEFGGDKAPKTWADLTEPGMTRAAELLQQRHRRRRAASLYVGEVFRLGAAREIRRQRPAPRRIAAARHADSGEWRTRRCVRDQRQHRLAVQEVRASPPTMSILPRGCRPSRARSAS